MAAYYDNPEELQEVNSYIDELRAQDDRSCVIMIAARIESLLERAIDQRLIEPYGKRRKDLVLNFANAIDLSYRLGILHCTHAEALHALRRWRIDSTMSRISAAPGPKGAPVGCSVHSASGN